MNKKAKFFFIILLIPIVYSFTFIERASNLAMNFNNSNNDSSPYNINATYVIKGDDAISYYDFKIMQNSEDLWGSNDNVEYGSPTFNVDGILLDSNTKYLNTTIRFNGYTKKQGVSFYARYKPKGFFSEYAIIGKKNYDSGPGEVELSMQSIAGSYGIICAAR